MAVVNKLKHNISLMTILSYVWNIRKIVETSSLILVRFQYVNVYNVFRIALSLAQFLRRQPKNTVVDVNINGFILIAIVQHGEEVA